MLHADPCGRGSKQNENWDLNANGTISSLQPNTPFCLGTKGTAAGAGAVLDTCGASSSTWTAGFAKGGGKTGTIVQKGSGLCLTVKEGGAAPNVQSYQPMRKKGAIILATGGDNSNSAKGNFCASLSPRLHRALQLRRHHPGLA